MRTEQTLPRSVSKNDIKISGTSKRSAFELTKKIIIIIFIFATLTVIYSFLEPYWIETKKYTIYSADVPGLFDGYSIVFLSDIHHGRNYSLTSVKKLVKKVNNLNPDLVLLGGDYVEGSPKYIIPCINILGKLNTSFGFVTMGVLGNHDHWQGASLTRRMMAESGIICLDNRAVWIRKGNQRIRIGGVGDHCE
ncbi:MAG: hypothetical protein GX640_00005, partial [Fibrobacter sp.]|nr:hypothetical protein [Fibrobacter sp.]